MRVREGPEGRRSDLAGQHHRRHNQRLRRGGEADDSVNYRPDRRDLQATSDGLNERRIRREVPEESQTSLEIRGPPCLGATYGGAADGST